MTIRRSIRVAAVALAAAICTLPALAQKRVALVIGNAAYKEQPLRNPVNDARAMAAALRESGFEVTVKENLAKAGLEQAIAEWGERLKAGDTAVFYYAGHGVQVRGQNYLQPVDARLTNENRVRIEAVPADLVLEQMAAAGVKVSVVVLDACRDNPFERRFRSSAAAGGLAQLTAPEGTLIAYATAPGKLALDGDGRNSIYTTALVRALRQPGLNVEDVFKQVRVEVSRATQGQQVPWESSSLTGDFVFRSGAPAAAPQTAALPPPAAPAPRVADPDEAERVFFESARDSRSRAMLDAYLQRYPQGRHHSDALALLASLPAAAVSQGATAARKFDGVYVGMLSCGRFQSPNSTSTPFQRSLVLDVRDHAVRYELGSQGIRGHVQLFGSVADDGAIEVTGEEIWDQYRAIALSGTISGEVASLTGNWDGGFRRCTLEATRQAVARTAAERSLPRGVGERGGRAVGTDEIRRDVVARSFDITLSSGESGVQTWSADGTVSWRGRISLNGTWRLSDVGLCTSYPDFRGGAEICFQIFHLPDGTYMTYESVNGAWIPGSRWQLRS